MSIPTLQVLLKAAFDHEISNIHTALPGHIVKYDPVLQKADVKPDIKKKYYNGYSQDMPIISNVPIVFPRSSKAFIKFPLEPNDGLLLIFSERSLERWLSLGGTVEPGNNRKFDISDCIAIPGAFSFAQPIPDSSNNLVVKYNDASYVINNDNKIAAGNSAEELLDLIVTLLDTIKSITYGGNALDPGGVAQIDALKTRFDTIKGTLS